MILTRTWSPWARNVFIPFALAVQADSPWKTFNELLDYTKKNPGKIRFNTIGVGSTPHFDMEIVQSVTGRPIHSTFPFKGGENPLSAALLGGHVEMTFDAINKFVPMWNRKMRLLLLSNKVAEFPNVPTLRDLGYKEDLPALWMALFGPVRIARGCQEGAGIATEKAIRNPELKPGWKKCISSLTTSPPEETKRMVSEEYKKASAVAKKLGLGK